MCNSKRDSTGACCGPTPLRNCTGVVSEGAGVDLPCPDIPELYRNHAVDCRVGTAHQAAAYVISFDGQCPSYRNSNCKRSTASGSNPLENVEISSDVAVSFQQSAQKMGEATIFQAES